MTPSLHTVVLLHGLARSSRGFTRLARRLEAEDYRVENLDYPSREGRLDQHVEQLTQPVRQIAEKLPPDSRVHIVGHSLGCLIGRRLLAAIPEDRAGRLVMLGPPNQGSAIADFLLRPPLVRSMALTLLGPALKDLTERRPVPNHDAARIGIIAGTRSIDPFGWLLLAKPNDGRVTVAGTQISGACHLTMPVTHVLMASEPHVIQATLHFLQTGSFPVQNHE